MTCLCTKYKPTRIKARAFLNANEIPEALESLTNFKGLEMRALDMSMIR